MSSASIGVRRDRNCPRGEHQLFSVTTSPRTSSMASASDAVINASHRGRDDYVFSPESTHNELSPVTSDYDTHTHRSRRNDDFTASLVSSGGFVNIEDNPEEDDDVAPLNITSHALNQCTQTIWKPYMRLLSLLGWHPIITTNSYKLWARLVNSLYPLVIMVIIVLGYIIQWAMCFRRLPNQFEKHGSSASNHTTANVTDLCHTGVFTNYIIPDFLHATAFLYSFYVIRWKESEHLVTLMERVFIQTSPAHSGWLSRLRLVRRLRFLLVFNVLWVLLSIGAHVLRIVSLTFGVEHRYDLHFRLFHTGDKAYYVLLVFLLAGLAAMDVVYASVTINYAIQCQLLITDMRCIMLRTRQKLTPLEQTMKDIYDMSQYLRTLNDKVATAVSMLLFNVAGLLVVRIYEIFTFPQVPIFIAANMCRAFVLLTLLVLPVVQACRVTNSGYALRRLGHEIAIRPFGYKNTPPEEIQSFHLFASTLQPRAKLFRVPFHASWVMAFTVGGCFLLLVALQVEVIGTVF